MISKTLLWRHNASKRHLLALCCSSLVLNQLSFRFFLLWRHCAAWLRHGIWLTAVMTALCAPLAPVVVILRHLAPGRWPRRVPPVARVFVAVGSDVCLAIKPAATMSQGHVICQLKTNRWRRCLKRCAVLVLRLCSLYVAQSQTPLVLINEGVRVKTTRLL